MAAMGRSGLRARSRTGAGGAADCATCNCAALRQAARHVTRLYDDALAPLGLGANQYSILSTLEGVGASAIHEVAARLVMDRSTLGHLLRPLEERRLVRRKRSPHDARTRIVAVTAEGRAALERGRVLWADAQGRFERALGTGTSRRLRVLLDRVAGADFGAFRGQGQGRPNGTWEESCLRES